MTDYESIMATPTGLPVAQIFFNAGGKTGGTVMWFFVILVQVFTGCSAMLANARMAWAFSRDHAFPFSGWVITASLYPSTEADSRIAFGAR
jgi:amino acid transporter